MRGDGDLFVPFPPPRVYSLQTKVPEPSEEEKASSAVLLCLSPHITEILEQGLLRCGKVTLFSILSLLAGWYEAFSVEQKPKVCRCACVSVCLCLQYIVPMAFSSVLMWCPPVCRSKRSFCDCLPLTTFPWLFA